MNVRELPSAGKITADMMKVIKTVAPKVEKVIMGQKPIKKFKLALLTSEKKGSEDSIICYAQWCLEPQPKFYTNVEGGRAAFTEGDDYEMATVDVDVKRT
jgi:hypothetical protein